jgi:predicted pyridoxine 5'-phosphate oxidase superfamily flavin-nucleotide-binding protein
MSDGYHAISDTEHVLAAQIQYGSRAAQARGHHAGAPDATEPRDELTGDEREFIATLDGFYMASVSDTGWPYVQFRGGPPGFVHTPDERTIAWADFRGNRQYVSTGNLAHDERVSLIFMDYPNQTRLKVYGRAHILDVREHPELAESLVVPGYRAVIERAVSITVAGFDWNCPQHITPRYSVAELDAILGPSWRPSGAQR